MLLFEYTMHGTEMKHTLFACSRNYCQMNQNRILEKQKRTMNYVKRSSLPFLRRFISARDPFNKSKIFDQVLI